MSFDTYISLLLGDLIALAFTILMAISQTKNNKEGKRQIKALKFLFVVPIALAIVLTSIFFASSARQKKLEYNQLISDAYFDVNNKSYLDAAEHYYQASLAAYNSDTILEATYGEGMCYFLYATETFQSQYFQKAAKIYTYIIENKEYYASEPYVDAIVDMSQIYYFLDYSWDEPEWAELIVWLENKIASERIDDISSADELSLRLKIVYALGLYYDHATHSDFDNFRNSELAAKALMYYDEYHYLYQLTAETKGELTIPDFYTSNILNIVDFLFVYGISSDDPEMYISAAIEMCETELNRLKATDISLVEYIGLKESIGKGQIFLSYLYDDKGSIYLQRAYQSLVSLLEIRDKDSQASLMNVGYYLVRTNLCSNEELDRILQIYNANLSQVLADSNSPVRIKNLISACSTCRWIIENYDFSSYAYESGMHYAEELNTQLADFLSDDDRIAVDKLYAFFNAIEVDAPVDFQPSFGTTELNAPTGYQIMVSSSRVELLQMFTVTVIPNEENVTSIVIHAKDPTGELWDFSLSDGMQKELYIDRADLVGIWTIYADVSNEFGTYYGADTGHYVQLTVEGGVVGDILDSTS